MNIDGYKELGGTPSHAMTGFASLLAIKHPKFFKPFPEGKFPGIEKELSRRRRDHEVDLEIWTLALRALMLKEGLLPKIPST